MDIDKRSRREFLVSTGVALTAGVVLGADGKAIDGDAPKTSPPNDVPLVRSLPLEGIHAYTDRVSAAAGETIRFYVSATHPYEFQICRLAGDADSPAADVVLFTQQVNGPVMQPIHPGSYIHVDRRLDDELITAITLECWLRLWDLPGEAAIIGQFDRSQGAGYALFVKRDGSLGFYLGDGGAFQQSGFHWTESAVLTRTETSAAATPAINQDVYGGRSVKLGNWHHVVATFDGRHKELWVDGERVGRWLHDSPARPGRAPLRIGACGHDGRADLLLDADLAMPAIYGRALNAHEIAGRFQAQALTQPDAVDLLACWPLREERGDRVADSSGQERHARIINHGTWMIGGPTFDANVERFADYDPAADTRRGHGLRLASDDLYDCGWQPTFEFELPADAKSGIYVGRFRFQRHDQPRLYHVLFVVRKPVAAPRAPIAFLCSTNTWRAYSGTPFAESWPGVQQTIGHAYINSPGGPPEFSFYWQHKAGQGSYQMGLRMPWPIAGPYTFHQNFDWRCSHLCHADRLTLDWLEREGYPVDVYADRDLHQQPDLLDGYRTVYVVGHSEYWSADAWNGLRKYLDRGGTVICLSGNTMFWRVSFNDDATILECRKVDAPGSQVLPERRGEAWHSHDGRRGGMSRECGYPAWPLLGLEYMAVHAVGVEGVGPYLVRGADHPLFHHPHELNLRAGDKLGGSPSGLPQPIGHEGDVRLSTLAKVLLSPVPAGATPPAEDPAGIVLLADGFCDWSKVTNGAPWDYLQRAVLTDPQRSATNVSAEMVYWERPDGGRVFHAGSVSAGRAFANDPKFGLLMKNVLHRFGVPAPKPS
ncbi:MAG TPA: LamG domain-containing protein [Pirellulales bacterium]|nr:LamG domain-containing protein [Pirellulales bacterium]